MAAHAIILPPANQRLLTAVCALGLEQPPLPEWAAPVLRRLREQAAAAAAAADGSLEVIAVHAENMDCLQMLWPYSPRVCLSIACRAAVAATGGVSQTS